MKDKIYHILQNALVIDDGDSSVNYQKSQISNQFNEKITIDELYAEFKENPQNIFMHDTRNCISYILKDNSEISLNVAKAGSSFGYGENEEIIFLKISNQLLKDTDNEILIPYDFEQYYQKDVQWQTMYKQINHDLSKYINKNPFEIADADIYGYDNCLEILNNVCMNRKKYGSVPAIDFADEQFIKLGAYTYVGYLPALGQLTFIDKYFDMINYIFDLPIAGKTLWSSTEGNANYTWKRQMHANNDSRAINVQLKDQKNDVMVLFKKFKNPGK